MNISRKTAFVAGAALAILAVVAIGYANAQNATNNSTTDGGGMLPGHAGHVGPHGGADCPLHHKQQGGATASDGSPSNASTAATTAA